MRNLSITSKQPNNVQQRESNAELLRIICMLMIVLHHFIYHAYYADFFENPSIPHSLDESLLLFLHCTFFIGVNCFILISGWYTIKVKLNSFVKIYLCISFYKLLAICRFLFFSGAHYSVLKSVYYIVRFTLLPFSAGSELWFIDCYILLFLLSPVLNLVIDKSHSRLLYTVTILMSIYNIYTGLMGKVTVNYDGYCAIQFVWMYLLGASLRSFIESDRKKIKRITLFLIYLASSLCWGIITIYLVHQSGKMESKFWHPIAYNNLFVVLSSICFFLFMMSFHFKSKFINKVASSVLAAYFIQEGGVIDYSWFPKPTTSPLINILSLLALTLVFFSAAIVVDKTRMIVLSPLYRKIEMVVKKIDDKYLIQPKEQL